MAENYGLQKIALKFFKICAKKWQNLREFYFEMFKFFCFFLSAYYIALCMHLGLIIMTEVTLYHLFICFL